MNAAVLREAPGRLQIEDLDIDAFDAMSKGEVARSVIVFDG